MRVLKSLVLAAAFSILAVGCSTTAPFRIPAGNTVKVTDRTVVVDENGEWKTSPFFWSVAGGAPYRMMDANGNIVRQGKLKTNFRAASIFWPPFALIYWPMGLNKQGYDLTKPADGYQVIDWASPAAAPAAPVQEATVHSTPQEAKKEIKKNKKKK